MGYHPPQPNFLKQLIPQPQGKGQWTERWSMLSVSTFHIMHQEEGGDKLILDLFLRIASQVFTLL